MPGFTRRFTTVPTLTEILRIEGVSVIDLVPPNPVVGAGSGNVLLVGEFEDGEFATDIDTLGAVQVFGSQDYLSKFGGFGYVYGGVRANNPSGRKHLGECWNGNGYLKGFKLRAQGLMIGRVDTSVGAVSFDVLASIDGGAGPFQLAAGETLSLTTDTGTGTTAALTALAAVSAGASQAFATIASGDTFGVKIDGGPQVNVVFGAADINQAAVIARINATLGYTAAAANTTEVDIKGVQKGTGGSVQLIEVTTGVLAKLGHTVGTTAGTSNIAANIDAVTVAEVIALVNATSAITTAHGKAVLTAAGKLRIINSTATSAASIQVAAGTMATALGLSPIGVAVLRSGHPAGTIPAGTRLHATSLSGKEWVTMQTQDIPAGVIDPIVVKVRPGLDDGTHVGASAATVDTIVDNIDFAALVVTNPSALTAALTEVQLDNRYLDAFNASLTPTGPARNANYLLSARRSDTVIRNGRDNALSATAGGLVARKFVTGDPLGTLVNQSLVNVAKWRSDRVFYTTKGFLVQIPDIAERGTAGGIGFTADGIITVRPDGPLTTVCAIIPPEENPGEATGLIDDFFKVAADGETLTVDTYAAWKAAGICAPIVDTDTGSTEFQSGVTSSLDSGRETIARRKMADFIQDTAVVVGKPFVKQLARETRRNNLRGRWESFLAGLKSEQNAELSRIVDYSVSDKADAGNTADTLALGVYFIKTAVRTLSSLDDIVFQTEIGPNATISREL